MNHIHEKFVNSFVFKNGSEVFDWKKLVKPETIDRQGFFNYGEIDPELKQNIERITLKEGNGSCTYITYEMPVLKIDQIQCTYSGKTGCMCGCLGQYRYTKAGESEIPDYYTGEDRKKQINESAVKRAYTAMKELAFLCGVEVISDKKRTIGRGDIFSIDFYSEYSESFRRKTLYLLEA